MSSFSVLTVIYNNSFRVKQRIRTSFFLLSFLMAFVCKSEMRMFGQNANAPDKNSNSGQKYFQKIIFSFDSVFNSESNCLRHQVWCNGNILRFFYLKNQNIDLSNPFFVCLKVLTWVQNCQATEKWFFINILYIIRLANFYWSK